MPEVISRSLNFEKPVGVVGLGDALKRDRAEPTSEPAHTTVGRVHRDPVCWVPLPDMNVVAASTCSVHFKAKAVSRLG